MSDSKHGMFCNVKAVDFGRFEESYPLYHLVVFWGVIDSNILFNFPLQFSEISKHSQVVVTRFTMRIHALMCTKVLLLATYKSPSDDYINSTTLHE